MKKLRRQLCLQTAAGMLLLLLLGGQFFRLASESPARADPGKAAPETYLRTAVIPAARGEIYDRNGRPLVTNRAEYVLCFDRFGWQDGAACRVIGEVLALLDDAGTPYADAFPLSASPPWRWTCVPESGEARRVSRFLKNYGLSGDMDAEEAVPALCRAARMPEGSADGEVRRILGVLYDMFAADFSFGKSFAAASDVPLSLAAAVTEQPERFPGVTLEIRPVRQYETDCAAHVLGTTGPIPAEESDAYAALGYPMDAVIGRDGAERAFEEWLRGTDGARLVETDGDGRVLRTVEETPARSGARIELTLDIGLQAAAEQALERRILALRAEGLETGGGAAAVVSVKDGEVLALASWPGYSLKSYRSDYAALAADPEKPLFNRAIAGVYAPGSAFKMVTAAAALEAGAAAPDTLIDCEGVYTYYAPDYLYRCWVSGEGGAHGPLTAAQALQLSCNCYFYEAGRLAGIRAIDEWAARFGLGQRTGIELPGEAAGVLAGPESRSGPWYAGDTLQAAIGQSDHLFTPLQLAGYAAALANGGVRYQLHLLRRAEYGGETLYEAAPRVLDTLSLPAEVWETLRAGMLAVTEEGTASGVFEDFPVPVLGKSGSAQVETGRANGVFILAAPADDPEIAAAVVLEHGGSGNNAALAARDILSAWFGLPLPGGP